uniref:RNA-directed DNA polymerase n=1 Tax=Melanaphis sacchari TaxID=742174 RepID=A0A2H8THY5_9HEMI
MLNISEELKNVNMSDLNKILYDSEYEIYTVESTNNHNERIEQLRKIIRTDHMDENERKTIYEICERYNSIFHMEGDILTFTNAGTHVIRLKQDQPPIYRRPYRLPHAQQDEINAQIKKLEDNDIIESSRSPWNSPLLLVRKKIDNSGKQKFRIVVDFRALNEVTINEFHPLPNITEILDQLGQCQLFSVLHLSSGFYQIKLEKESRELTAFSTNQGHWHFKRMIQGMKTSPGTFQRVMNSALAGLIGIKCLVYLDDIIVYGKNLYDHNEKLIEVFERLQTNNLKLQPDKCEFLKRECVYLGHVISENGIKPDEKKVKSVLEFPKPKTVKDIKSFLGLSGYYRKFIDSYSAIAKPLTNLLKKDIKFVWSEECQKSFDKLKAALCSKPILKYPDFTKPFILTTDASNKALGAILSQGEIGQDLPISYASRTLNKSENNYSTTELECLAIIFGVKQFRPYLYGRKFIILSDHRPLTWLFNLKNPLSKLARWRIQLEEYDYEIRYKPGVQNSNVDALSRMYSVHEIKNESYEEFLEKMKTQLITNNNIKETIGTLLEAPIEYHIVSEIAKQYNLTSGINYEIKQKFGIKTFLPVSKVIGDTPYVIQNNRYIIFLVTKNRDRQRSTYENIYIALVNLKQLCEENKLNKIAMNKLGFNDDLEWDKIRSMLRYIFRNTKIEIIVCTSIEYSEEEKAIILKQFHDSKLGGHLGVNKTVKRIQKQFRWKGMKNDVKKYIKNCTSCQVNKISNRHVKQPMAITSTSSKPFEKIFLDIVGPLPTTLSSNNYILTMQDDLSKYTLGVPIPNHQANTVAEAFVIHFVCVHGIPGTILTDQGTDFLSKTFTEVCKLLKINKINTSPFRPQTNGGLERSHRTLAEYLRHYVDKNLNNWDHLLPYAFFVYNSTVHTSTNYQPYALVYGRTLEIPIKLKSEPEPQYNYDDYLYDLKQSMQVSHKLAREKLIENKVKSKERYDKKENPVDIHVKDLVLLKDNTHRNKLNSLWLGPYEVIEIIGDENIVIQRGRRGITVHKNNVKRYHNDKINE